jgi:hypothetical protein
MKLLPVLLLWCELSASCGQVKVRLTIYYNLMYYPRLARCPQAQSTTEEARRLAVVYLYALSAAIEDD